MSRDRDMLFCAEPNCEEYWIECSVCGEEFCTKCFANSILCSECAEKAELDREGKDAEEEGGEAEPDFKDVPNLQSMIEEETLEL